MCSSDLAIKSAALTLGADVLTTRAVNRARPDANLGVGHFEPFAKGGSNGSFPSTHMDAAFALVTPFAQDYNAPWLNEMIRRHRQGFDIVAASRFMPGGRMVGGPPLKVTMVRMAAWFMKHVARVPTHDASNGFRLFSRRVIEQIPVESNKGFAYSIEFLVKTHRLGWPITEVPVEWYERKAGESRFRIFAWLGVYLRWLFFALGTTYAGRGPASVALKTARGRL